MMEPWQAIELKHALDAFARKVLKEAENVNVAETTRVRYVLELNYDPIRGSIQSAGLETRKREEHSR